MALGYPASDAKEMVIFPVKPARTWPSYIVSLLFRTSTSAFLFPGCSKVVKTSLANSTSSTLNSGLLKWSRFHNRCLYLTKIFLKAKIRSSQRILFYCSFLYLMTIGLMVRTSLVMSSLLNLKSLVYLKYCCTSSVR